MGSPFRLFQLAGRRASRYVREDLREIVWPSSIPNPPGYVEEQMKGNRRLTWQEWGEGFDSSNSKILLVRRLRDLLAEEQERAKAEAGPSEATLRAELEATVQTIAKEGLHGLRPIFHQWYAARAGAWRDAVQVFIQGYREGLQESVPATPSEKPSDHSPGNETSNVYGTKTS
eukprot:9502937-Pyramimonas_sp.AAC.1